MLAIKDTRLESKAPIALPNIILENLYNKMIELVIKEGLSPDDLIIDTTNPIQYFRRIVLNPRLHPVTLYADTLFLATSYKEYYDFIEKNNWIKWESRNRNAGKIKHWLIKKIEANNEKQEKDSIDQEQSS